MDAPTAIKAGVVSPEKPFKKQRIKVLKPSQILKKQRHIYPFTGAFQDSFGQPESHAKWFFTGPSFSGKSSLLFMICNELTKYGLVDYNNHEEAGGDSDTVAKKISMSGLDNKDGLIRLFKAPIESETHETFMDRLLRKKSAQFGVLDSMQHAELNKQQYLRLTDMLCNPRRKKSLLFISHWVKNDFTKFVKHDCDIKVEVMGYVANVESRYGGGKPFIIWEAGARKHWGKNYNKVVSGKYWPGKKK